MPPFLAEPGQTPHITMWHYGCERLFRCCCAGSMRREGYSRCAGAVVLGYGRSAPLNTAVECSSSPQHWGSKATGRAPCGPGSGKTEISCRHRDTSLPRCGAHLDVLPGAWVMLVSSNRTDLCKKRKAVSPHTQQKRSTGPSRVVPHRSTTPARTSLTSLFGWEAVSLVDMAALIVFAMP